MSGFAEQLAKENGFVGGGTSIERNIRAPEKELRLRRIPLSGR
jgi:hypothetical protein